MTNTQTGVNIVISDSDKATVTQTVAINWENINEYKETELDARTNEADFLLTSCNGGSYTIQRKSAIIISGRGVKCKYSENCFEITEAKLNQLKKKYKWETDF